MAMHKKLRRKQTKAQEVRGLGQTQGLNTRKGAMQRAIKGAMNRQSEHHCNAQARESNGRLKGNAPFLASKIPEY
jgi:hypothetical protein